MLLALRPNYPPTPVVAAEGAVAADLAILLGFTAAEVGSATEGQALALNAAEAGVAADAATAIGLTGAGEVGTGTDAPGLIQLAATDVAGGADVVLLMSLADSEAGLAADVVSLLLGSLSAAETVSATDATDFKPPRLIVITPYIPNPSWNPPR